MSIQEIATIKVQDQNYTIVDKNITSDEIAFSSFSGMMGFVGELGKQTIEKYGLNALYGSRFGRVFDVVDGVINGVFDSNMNPDKSLEKLIGTQFLAWAPGEIGAAIGGMIAGPPGAVAGAVIGSIIGGINADDWYGNGEIFFTKLVDKINDDFEYLSPTIYGKVTQEEFILQSVENDSNFCKNIFPDYVNYRQITEIKSGSESFLYNQLTKNATVNSSDEKTATEVILKNTNATKLTLNNQTYNIASDNNNLLVRNALDSIPAVSVLLSHIDIYAGEKIDLGDKGVYTVKGGDTFSQIANTNGFNTKELLKRNTWLIDEGKVHFDQDKVLVDINASDLTRVNHTLYGTNAEDILKDLNGGYDTYIAGNKDTITDSDGKGRVFFNGSPLTGGEWDKDEGVYKGNKGVNNIDFRYREVA